MPKNKREKKGKAVSFYMTNENEEWFNKQEELYTKGYTEFNKTKYINDAIAEKINNDREKAIKQLGKGTK